MRSGSAHTPISARLTKGYHGTYLANVSIVATSVSVTKTSWSARSFGNHDSQVGDNVAANTDGDNNAKLLRPASLNIQWGADNLDKATDTVTGTFSTLVQDTPGDASATTQYHLHRCQRIALPVPRR